MKILIDARLYGPKNTGNGRYTQNLVENLANIDKDNEYFILLRKIDFETLSLPNNWNKVLCDINHYSFAEQFKLPLVINKIAPDIVHFPHFNVPILYFGNFIVTIHDMIMHKFVGGEATTRKFPIYQIWRLGYYIAFAKAIYGSKKIIVPSKFVKNEVLKFYKVNNQKIEVIYE